MAFRYPERRHAAIQPIWTSPGRLLDLLTAKPAPRGALTGTGTLCSGWGRPIRHADRCALVAVGKALTIRPRERSQHLYRSFNAPPIEATLLSSSADLTVIRLHICGDKLPHFQEISELFVVHLLVFTNARPFVRGLTHPTATGHRTPKSFLIRLAQGYTR